MLYFLAVFVGLITGASMALAPDAATWPKIGIFLIGLFLVMLLQQYYA